MYKAIARWFSRRKDRRRKDILASPFPSTWGPVVSRTLRALDRLPATDMEHLHKLVQVFVSEKEFLGCAGLVVTDEIKVTIASGACLLLLGIPHLDIFPRLREIIVYPGGLTQSVEAIGPDGRPYEINTVRAGEAWRRGPVVLAWDSVARSVATPRDGYNVVYHEFAHVLDMQSGAADGMPPLESREQVSEWAETFYREFDRFVENDRLGRSTFIDPYGASNAAEFFAVATEHFFEQSRQLKRAHPELYSLFAGFFKVDPISWSSR